MEQKVVQEQVQTAKSPIPVLVKTRIRKANRPLTREQVQAIMLKVDNLRDAAMLHLGFNVGLRVSELVTFNQDAVDWQQGCIKIWDEKKDKYRWIYPPLESIAKIRQWLTQCKPGMRPIFGMSMKSAQRVIQRWTKAVIGEARSWHTVRHTYISICAEDEKNPAIVVQNTGDRPATILQYYTHLSPGFMRRAVEEKPVYTEVKK